MKIPDITKDKNHYIKNCTFDIAPINDTDVKFWFNDTENSVYLEVDNLGATFNSTDFRYMWKGPLGVYGKMNVKIGKIMIRIGLDLQT
jgi:hypothetical protein